MRPISHYLPAPGIPLVLCCLAWIVSGCTSLPINDTSSENAVVTGVWIFEDEQIEIKLAKVDNAELLPAPTKNATRFTIAATTNKLIKYKTEMFKIDEQQINALQKTSLSGRPFLSRLDKDTLRGESILSTFRGSIAMHRDTPVDFTIQNTDIDSNTPYVYSRISMQVVAREYTGEHSLISNIECVSFPEFLCTKVEAPQSAKF